MWRAKLGVNPTPAGCRRTCVRRYSDGSTWNGETPWKIVWMSRMRRYGPGKVGGGSRWPFHFSKWVGVLVVGHKLAETATARRQHSQECKDPPRQCFVTRNLDPFWSFGSKFGDATCSCIGFWDIVRKNRHTENGRKTLRRDWRRRK